MYNIAAKEAVFNGRAFCVRERLSEGEVLPSALAENALDIITKSAEQTRMVGERLGALARASDLYCLEGDLGSGKTCFVQGLGRGLEIPGPIHSPTFILANEHRGGRLTLYHLDVYRVRGADEAVGFGLEDYMDGDGVCVIEWAEKVREALPPERLWIEFRHIGETERGLTFRATGERFVQLVNELVQGIDPAIVAAAAPTETQQQALYDQRGITDAARD